MGINTAISSRTGSFIGYSFAVPSNIAKKIIDDLLEFGSVQEAILGVAIDQSDKTIEGVVIADVFEEGGAKTSGLKSGDVIKKVNNVKIVKFSDLKGQLTAKRPGELVEVTVDRDGKLLSKMVQLSKRESFASNAFGVQLKDLNAKEKRKFKVSGGAKIIQNNNKILQYYNVGEGYVITKINGKEITNASDAASILDSYNPNQNMYIEMLSPEGQIEKFRF
ncbi:PDZ domain-containing protein [Tenacibaculum sp. SG-28]|uniref:PDZ domain-containing protein n=1 Tax=Tenacibaculum sp. SG-28 TaxID=754426 RepID=UPI003513057C